MLGVRDGLATATVLPMAVNCEGPSKSQSSWGRDAGTGAASPSSNRSSEAGAAAARPLRSEGNEGNKGSLVWVAGVNKVMFGGKINK